MNMKEFLKRLVPTLRRNELDQALDHIQETIQTAYQLLALYGESIDDGVVPQSDYYRQMNKSIGQRAKFKGKQEWITYSRDTLANGAATCAQIRDEFFSNTAAMVNTQLPLDRLMALRALASIAFLGDYMIAALRKFVEYENATITGARPATPVPVEQYLAANLNAAIEVLVILQHKDIAKQLKALPNADVDLATYDQVLEVQGRTRVDPLRFGFVALPYNPFHYIGIKWANWYATRYRKLKEEKRLLEARLLQYRALRNDEPDAKLDKAISYYEDEVNKLAMKLAKMED